MSYRQALTLLLSAILVAQIEAGIIKDVFQKITGTNNQTEDTVKQSAPICGNGIFSTPDERTLSPEVIFITNRPSNSVFVSRNSHDGHNQTNVRRRPSSVGDDQWSPNNERAHEFRFHTENVTLEALERYGFNRDAPVTFVMHGFTSGYPLQAWISEIVDAYTIDRETETGPSNLSRPNHDLSGYGHQGGHHDSYNNGQKHNPVPDHNHSHYTSSNSGHEQPSSQQGQYHNHHQHAKRDSPSHGHGHSHYSNLEHGSHENLHSQSVSSNHASNSRKLQHNLFIVNWHYAARGIVYPRAVANIPIVASYVTRFINDKLIGEAGVDPRRIELIGHSLGAHLAGYIGKNTRQKVRRIYGLDPAGPCFGAISGPLFPSSKRLSPNDAEDVITIHTNTVLLGIDKPIGRHSVFVEGGEIQPGCQGGGYLKSLSTLTIDGGDFDTIACSHSRAPHLLTHRHEQSKSHDSCQLVAYECNSWDNFKAGFCGLCSNSDSDSDSRRRPATNSEELPSSGACKRIGLDWTYPSSGLHPSGSNHHHHHALSSLDSHHQHESHQSNSHEQKRPSVNSERETYSSSGSGQYDSSSDSFIRRKSDRSRRSPHNQTSNENSNSTSQTEERRGSDDETDVKKLFLRTSDTQPYCIYHYQIVLQLRKPFEDNKKPHMALILQDFDPGRAREDRGRQQSSLSDDQFGNKFNEVTYTKLLTSARRLGQIDQATILFRDGLKNGHQVLKSLQVNYMSHIDPEVRRRLSTRLCLVRTENDRNHDSGAGNRFYFEGCKGNNYGGTSDHSH